MKSSAFGLKMADEAGFSSSLSSILKDYDKSLILRTQQLEVLRSIWDKDSDVVVSLPTGEITYV